MPQNLGQYQMQTERQLQKLSPLQLLTARLLELPVAEFENRVYDEVDDNITLVSDRDREFDDDTADSAGDMAEMDYGEGDADTGYGDGDDDYAEERTRTSSELDDYLSIDDAPDYLRNHVEQTAEKEESPLGYSQSFIEELMAQLADCDVSEHQRELVEYLIGSLDDNGFLSMSLAEIADDMLFSHNIYTDEAELQSALAILQGFDPPGIGARDSRECLLLQIDRKLNDREHLLGEKYFLLEKGREIISDSFDLFLKNNAEKLKRIYELSSSKYSLIMDELRKLNVRPGLSLSESSQDRTQVAVPDFIVDTDFEGGVTFRLAKGNLPPLRISREYLQQLNELEKPGRKLSRGEKESQTYLRGKYDAARLFIDAVRQRHETMTAVMRALVTLQREFFLSQNPADLKKMVLKDVAEKSHLDISTVSRVCNTKYCLLDGRLYPLKYLFRRETTNAEGEILDLDNVKEAIRMLTESEDKTTPYSDKSLSEQLSKRYGIKISRRTVAKYRSLLGIPASEDRSSI